MFVMQVMMACRSIKVKSPFQLRSSDLDCPVLMNVCHASDDGMQVDKGEVTLSITPAGFLEMVPEQAPRAPARRMFSCNSQAFRNVLCFGHGCAHASLCRCRSEKYDKNHADCGGAPFGVPSRDRGAGTGA